MRSEILNSIDADIYGIQETHLANNTLNQPYLAGYKWFGHCRKTRHIRSRLTHGGVGFFIRETLFQSYTISILDQSYEGIFCMLFKDKVSDYCFTVYCCYLPPEHSPYGRDSTAFYTHLLSLIYLHNFSDCSFIFGDLNGRIGDKLDTIDAVDHVNSRDVVDYTTNKHGDALLDFLIESRMVVANGRIEGSNDFTSISLRGKSVVDYFIVPIENISSCSSFKVMPVTDMMQHYNFETLLSERCRAPDHSVLVLKYKIDRSLADDNINNDVTTNDLHTDENISKRYNYGTMSPEFLKSNSWINILDSLIIRLENIEKCQLEIDTFYSEMLLHIFQEMDQHIEYKNASKSSRKHYKNHKPYWTDDLSLAWKKICQKRRNCISKQNKKDLS